MGKVIYLASRKPGLNTAQTKAKEGCFKWCRVSTQWQSKAPASISATTLPLRLLLIIDCLSYRPGGTFRQVAMNVNVIRLYSVNPFDTHTAFMEEVERLGLYVVVPLTGMNWGNRC